MKTKNPNRHNVYDAFRIGYKEAPTDMGLTYDGTSQSPRSRAYDAGLTIGEMPKGKKKREAYAAGLKEYAKRARV